MSSLAEILRFQLVPWAQQDSAHRFILARPEMHPRGMPPGVKLQPHPLAGKRVVVKNKRNYKNTRTVIAEWPADGVHEISKYSMVCVLAGHVDYQVGHFRVQCGAGHFILLPPGMPRPDGTRPYVDLQRGPSCELLTFLLHSNMVECWVSHGHAHGREQFHYCIIPHMRVVAVFQTLMEEMYDTEEGTEMQRRLIGEGLLLAFFNLVQREVAAGRLQFIRAKQPLHENALGRQDAGQTDFAARLERYVQANLRKPLTLERVARDMYLSSSHFARKMRSETGQSFNEYLAVRRLEEAKNLLENSGWSVSAIAGLVGFRSASYFCTFFKRNAGESPSGYRERLQEGVAPGEREKRSDISSNE